MNSRPLGGGRVLASLFLCYAGLFGGTTIAAAKNDQNKNKNGQPTATVTTYSAHATALRIDGVTQPVSGPIIIADTGPLPSSGGFIQKTESGVDIANGGLTIAEVEAVASGAGPQAAAESTLTKYHAEFVVTDGDHTHRAVIEADYIHAEVSATVDRKGVVALLSKVQIENLTVNGQAITVTGAPNQRVDLPPEVGGYLIINEQASAGGGSDGDIGVSAIHFFVCHCIEGHLGFVTAGITSEGKPTAPADCGKVTGGGWISGTPSGAKGTFGMSGGIRRGEYWGHLTYQDHGNGLKVKSTAVVGFRNDPADRNGRIIRYAVTINGEAGFADLRVVDNGEPGRDDIFDLTLSNGYRAAGDLGGPRPGGGNIQVHKCPPGWQ